MASSQKCSAVSRKEICLLRTYHIYIRYIIYHMVGRSIYSLSIYSYISKVQRHIYLGSDISAMDLPTVRYILHKHPSNV